MSKTTIMIMVLAVVFLFGVWGGVEFGRSIQYEHDQKVGGVSARPGEFVLTYGVRRDGFRLLKAENRTGLTITNIVEQISSVGGRGPVIVTLERKSVGE